MNTKRLIAVSFASLAISLTFFLTTSNAQTRVAIVDVGMIFKQHPTFAAELERLKQEADAFKTASMKAQQGLAQEAEGIKANFKPDSVDFKNAQTDLAQKAAGLQVDQSQKMKALMEREATLHFQTYQQVKNLIAQYCDAKGVQLVLRYNSQQMDPEQPGSVMARVNSSVVYHNPVNDITNTILSQVGAKVADAGLMRRN